MFTKPDISFAEYSLKKFKTIVLPYFFFGFISIVLIFLSGSATLAKISETALQYLLGIRNQLFAPALWFLPCLFVISLLFFGCKKIFKNRWVLLLLGLGALVISETLLPHRPVVQPSWFWNVDSALYYFFYFTLGHALFPYMRQLLSSKSNLARLSFGISAILVSLYAGTLILGKDVLAAGLKFIPGSGPFVLVLGSLSLIWFNVFLAQLLSSISLFKQLGRDTLYLCGSEQIIRHLVPPCLQFLGGMLNFPRLQVRSFLLLRPC